jgi:hypothetical protein
MKLKAIATLAAATGLIALSPAAATAAPVQGNTGWSVLLCKFSDQPAEPQNAQFFRTFLTESGRGLGGVADYFADQSGGRITLNGSVVQGWYTMPHTLAQDAPLDRWTRTQKCIDAAAAGGYQVPAGNRVVTILNAPVDSGSVGGRVVLDPNAWNVGFAAHEMLHGYGIDHSYSNDPNYRNVSWSQPGEYDDPWDQMSAMNIYSFTTARFGPSAVGLIGYQRDKLGWLNRPQIFTFGADGVGSRTMSLTALESAATSGVKMVRIPFNPGDLFNYYTVEFHRKTGWDAGIPGDTVLIHEVRNGIPYLIRNLSAPGRPPAQSLAANGVQISVGAHSGDAATVSITSDITTRCLSGYVWREARAGDLVCVAPSTRSDVAADNAAAASRRLPNSVYCVSGYVWREAYSGDLTCVVPARRSQAWADNAAAPTRVNPARFVYGPNTCASGYVWRDADASDSVCVPPATRSDAAADNAAAASRRQPNSVYCVSGYVWREAFPSDLTCVVPARRSQAWADNAAAASRLAHPVG